MRFCHEVFTRLTTEWLLPSLIFLVFREQQFVGSSWTSLRWETPARSACVLTSCFPCLLLSFHSIQPSWPFIFLARNDNCPKLDWFPQLFTWDLHFPGGFKRCLNSPRAFTTCCRRGDVPHFWRSFCCPWEGGNGRFGPPSTWPPQIGEVKEPPSLVLGLQHNPEMGCEVPDTLELLKRK